MDAERWTLLGLGLGATAVAAAMAFGAVQASGRRSSRRRRSSRLCFGLGYALLAIGQLADADQVVYGPWIERTAHAALIMAGMLWLARRRQHRR